MPFYDYRCTNKECLHTIELQKKISELDREEKCPVCNSVMQIVLHPTVDIWKVSGAYSKTNHGRE
jgi:putative FmdB family regulatory protein